MATPEVQSVFSVMGFSFSGSAPNQGIIFTMLKPFAERQGREHSLQEVVARLRGPLFGVQGAVVVPFIPPSIPGVNALGGFTFEVLDQGGGAEHRQPRRGGAGAERGGQPVAAA